jgi:hypothetical protein
MAHKAYRGGNIGSGWRISASSAARLSASAAKALSAAWRMARKLSLKYQRNGARSLYRRANWQLRQPIMAAAAWRAHGSRWRMWQLVLSAQSAQRRRRRLAQWRLAYRSGGSNAKWRICVAASTA